ncbi:hydantoinase/oxoprolinase family protein [Hoeflea sp. CAU 1731]
MKIGIEIGGTFTDLILAEAGRDAVEIKVPSTRDDPSVGAIDGVRQLLEKADRRMEDVTEILHGSTVATNALIERKGARTGLITTAGFEDVLLIARQDKTNIYDPFYRRPESLVPRDSIRGVQERVDATGRELIALCENDLLAKTADLVDGAAITSLAIAFLHSYRSPEHERRARDIIAETYPDLDISISSDTAPEFREFERTATTVVNAYVRPLVRRYIINLVEQLRILGFRHRLMIMQSNGGILPAEAAALQPVRMILSGPAAGVTGAISVVDGRDSSSVITMDVGGTSCDASIITEASPEMVSKGLSEYRIDGNPINIRMLDISTIGAGGGSIVHVDAGRMLRVGPQSAGSDPGPACYGRGGDHFTVTDALLLYGLIDPERFGGGQVVINPDLAMEAAAPLCRQLEMTPLQLAQSVYTITVSNIAQQIRRITVERGRDPMQYAIMPYGGGGSLFAAPVAQEIGTNRVIIPRLPGIFSSFGLTVAPMRLDAIKAVPGTALKTLDHATLNREFEVLEEELSHRYNEMGIDLTNVSFTRFGDARYVGQGFELTVELPPSPDLLETLTENFHAVHTDRYGHAFRSQAIELVNYRVDAILNIKRSRQQTYTTHGEFLSRSSEPPVPGGPVLTTYERASVPSGVRLAGPALIHEPASAIFVPADWQVFADENGVLELTRSEPGRHEQ